jgi:hypothetical protein
VHEDDIGLLEGGVRAAGTHGHTDVGGGQTGGVVDAVTDHSHAAALLDQQADGGELVLGPEFGPDILDLEFTLEVVGGSLAVTGEDDSAEALAVEFLDELTGLGADIVPQNEAAQERAFSEPDL